MSFASGKAQAPAGPQSPGCVLHKGVYSCDWASFRTAFDHAQNVEIQTGRLDRTARSQLEAMAVQLGKTVIPASHPTDQSADLTLVLAPAQPNGVSLGPSDQPAAILSVYAPNGMSSRGTLLWAETLNGKADLPWPAQVQQLVQQFRDRLKDR